jgi:hypothetical protein
MSTKINKVKKYIKSMQHKVVEVTKDHYKLDNGDVYEHQFEIDENITVDEFQKLLDNAKETIMSTLNNIEDEEE